MIELSRAAYDDIVYRARTAVGRRRSVASRWHPRDRRRASVVTETYEAENVAETPRYGT